MNELLFSEKQAAMMLSVSVPMLRSFNIPQRAMHEPGNGERPVQKYHFEDLVRWAETREKVLCPRSDAK